MKKYNDCFLYKALRPLIVFLVRLFLTPKIIGRDNIPEKGRIILAGNHTSILDSVLLISSTKRNIHFFAKKELWNGPKKLLFGNLGLIPVDRKKKNHNALEEGYNYLKNEKMVLIFPEGTTSKEKLLPFKIGAVKMAKETNSKIVPFAINGKYKLFSRHLKIEFLKPVEIKNDLEKENNKLKKTIEKGLENE